jgi:hypothetical protein
MLSVMNQFYFLLPRAARQASVIKRGTKIGPTQNSYIP